MKRGQDLVEKGKRLDEKRNFDEAIKNYESGVKLLLEAANDASNRDPKKSEAVRFKCLLIHERIETIRNHLDIGSSIRDRRDTSFDVTFGGSTPSLGCAGGFDSCSASPEPFVEESVEDRALLMEEVRSNLSLSPSRRDSVGSSRHSLYPTICEIKRSPVMLSEEDLVGVKRREINFVSLFLMVIVLFGSWSNCILIRRWLWVWGLKFLHLQKQLLKLFSITYPLKTAPTLKHQPINDFYLERYLFRSTITHYKKIWVVRVIISVVSSFGYRS